MNFAAKVGKIRAIFLIYFIFDLNSQPPVDLFLRIRLLLPVLLFILAFQHSLAQDPYFKQFRVEDGLPSNEVYKILFDHNNILWATTDRGVWRFDGYQSKQITVADGLGENANFRMFLDRNNQIWLTSISNYLYRIINDSVCRHPASNQVHLYGRSDRNVQHLIEEEDGSVLLCYNRPGLFRFRGNEPPEQLTNHIRGHENNTVCIFLDSSRFWWDMIQYPDTIQNLEPQIRTTGTRIYLTGGFRNEKNDFRKELCLINRDEFLFSFANTLLHIRKGVIIEEKRYPSDILSLCVDDQGAFWIGLEKYGVNYYPTADLNAKPKRYLRNESVTGVVQDHEGGYWFSTLSSGIFQVNSLGMAVYRISEIDAHENVVTALASDGQTLFLGTETGRVFKGTADTPEEYTLSEILPAIPSSGIVRKLFINPDHHLLIFRQDLLETDFSGHPVGIRSEAGYPYDYTAVDQDQWMVSRSMQLDLYSKGKTIRTWEPSGMKDYFPADTNLWNAVKKVRALHFDTARRLWLGSQEYGLFTSDSVGIFHWKSRDTLLGKRIRDIISAGNNIWISIADHGIAIIRPDSTIVKITQKDGLSSDIVDCLHAENDSVVWAGTNQGINRIATTTHGDSILTITPLTIREGLPSNRIFQIINHRGDIWLGTTRGAVCLLPQYMRRVPMHPSLVLDTILVNGTSRDLAKNKELAPNENDLIFKFKAISYRIPHDLNYRYYLKNIDRDSIVTQNLEARYPDLPHGNYTFHLNASYNSVFDPDTEITLPFTIRKHWYQTWVFRVGCALIGGLALYLIFIYLLKEYKRGIHQKQQLLEAEKKSLLSQMNPHFIFNSLNSIQHFIIQKDDYQANNYLSDFSALIRKILDNSRKNMITLNEEIETLTLYLDMEKLRFEEGFEYRIIRDPSLDYNEVMIPPMMIQPFVENAIWHGLMPLGGKGLVTLTFSQIGGFYHCLICDNGIGRQRAAQMKGRKEPHTSTGVSNVTERIRLMNGPLKNKIQLTIKDLRDPQGVPAGTLVELLLPLNWD